MNTYKTAIWGTGEIYKSAVRNGSLDEADIVCFIDNAIEGSCIFEDKKKYSLKEFLKSGEEVDYILVMNNFSEEIFRQCKSENMVMEKIIFFRNYKVEKMRFSIINEKQTESEKLFKGLLKERESAYKEEEKKILVKRCCAASHSSLFQGNFDKQLYEDDYFRYRTFELVADEIQKNNVQGSVAEIGVFRGDFACLINARFPERKLYLFDTFSSFNRSEFDREINNGRWTKKAYDIFRNTSVELVLDKMPCADQCIVKQGLFPDSAKGLKEEFAFVSLDVDLEESTYQSLEYMYERLAKGGYIFIHDYNNKGLDGVAEAVRRYEEKYEKVLCKVPIADWGGSLIVYKPFD